MNVHCLIKKAYRYNLLYTTSYEVRCNAFAGQWPQQNMYHFCFVKYSWKMFKFCTCQKKKKKKLRHETQKITELIITLISIILKYITEKYREDIWCCELLWCFLWDIQWKAEYFKSAKSAIFHISEKCDRNVYKNHSKIIYNNCLQ